MENSLQTAEYILGLDIGTNSIGWAIVNAENGKPIGLAKTGVRIFAAGVGGDIESGSDKSRAVKRREARLHRRQLERTRRRLDKLVHLLQKAELLPPGDFDTPEQRVKFFSDLDNSLFTAEARHSDPHVLPYLLRARALDEKLAPYELGRALYHLAQRRGFASNLRQLRKRGEDEKKRKEDEGVVKIEIGKLANDLGDKTLGQYFSQLDLTKYRIRHRYTDRKMYEKEFRLIWDAQRQYYPSILSEELHKKVWQAIFFQRPLKSQKHLVGKCELEPPLKRAPFFLLAAQRFRLLQKVNDLTVKEKAGALGERQLTSEEREKLVNALEIQEKMGWAEIRRLLKLTGCKFNFETSEEKLIGNRTAAALYEVFGERWNSFSIEEKEKILGEMRSYQNLDGLKSRGMKVWGLDEQLAQKLTEIDLEEGYCRLSRRALAKVLPLMEQGIQYARAQDQIYGRPQAPILCSLLPPLAKVVDVRNPAVQRALSEARKVVNSIIREYGKPARIRIELVRDLKKARKEREKISKKNFENRKAREDAKQNLEQAGIFPSRDQIEKWLLWQECGKQCPYTGKTISFSNLFGDSPHFHVEHIIPLYRPPFDNSFMNKTLCHNEENQRKGNRTPWEAYGNTERWEDIIKRVNDFGGGVPQSIPQSDKKSKSKARKLKKGPWTKLNQFMLDSPNGEELASLDEFSSRQLNDAAYASRLAKEYLGILYGASADGIDPRDKRCIQVGRGKVTGFLRDEWGLNAILGGGEKTRDNHKQHAIDAIVVALTDEKTVKMLSQAAEHALEEHRRRFGRIPLPWEKFLNDVNHSIQDLIVSHRAARKVSDAIHKETYYSKPFKDEEGRDCVHVRVPLKDLKTDKQVARIVDPTVRQRIIDARTDSSTKPIFKTKDGREIPILSARVRVYDRTDLVGEGARRRRVILESNHHIEIFETEAKKGCTSWEGAVVTTYEAMQRLRTGKPIIKRDFGEGMTFKFSLTQGEIIEIDDCSKSGKCLYVIEKITRRIRNKREYLTVGFVGINDARKSTGAEKEKVRDLRESSPEVLRKLSCRKVTITPLGEIRNAND